MTTDTTAIIRRLAETVEPVRPLPSPWMRTAAWLALGLPSVAIMVLVMSPRSDLRLKISDPRFVLEQVAAFTTAVTAAVAAFATVVPGINRRVLVLPLVPVAAWVGGLGLGCAQAWIQLGAAGMSLRPDWFCFPAIIGMGAFPAITMAVMLRRGAPLTPNLTSALGGLAAGGVGNFGLRLVHPQDASVMVLVWQVGTVCVLSALAGCAGRYLLRWRSDRGQGFGV